MDLNRRLWTGDWEQDSAARAEELAAARRQRRPWEPEPEPEQPEPATAAWPPPAAAPASRRPRTPLAVRLAPVRRRLPARIVVPILTALLLIAAVAVALTSLLSSNSNSNSNDHVSSAAVREADRWLGAELVAGPGGTAVLETVDPNGAAAFAGLEPGDVISQVNGQAIDSLGAAANAIDGMSSGQQALIVVDRGSGVAAASFAMPARPGGP
jgi:membrane-associated protease RseP (regulator of RpoE activity)